MGVKVTSDRIDAIISAVAALTKQQVVVGIPAESNERDPEDGASIGNADLLAIHEFGSPAANIPARPTLIPGVKAYQPRAIKRLKKAAESAIDAASFGGSTQDTDVNKVKQIAAVSKSSNERAPVQSVTDQLNAIGLEAVASVKNQFTEGNLAPLKPATIAARKRDGFEGERPLVRTGDLMRHINYAIVKTK
jgi:hypothetical protein